MKKVLEVYNIEVKLGKQTILKTVSFDIEEGKIVGLVGPNGAGKSTTMKTIVGFIFPERGKVLINGYDVYRGKEKALAGVDALIENPAFYENISGFDNLKLWKDFKKVTREQIIENAMMCGLTSEQLKKKVKKYSTGLKQRLALTKVLLGNPKFVILDEPTNGLDPTGKIEFKEIIKKVKKEKGTTFLISSHLLDELEDLCDKFVFINNGKIIKELEKSDIMQSQKYTIIFKSKKEEVLNVLDELHIKYYSIGGNEVEIELDGADITEINSYLMSKNIRVEEIKRKKKDLEEVYREIFIDNIGC